MAEWFGKLMGGIRDKGRYGEWDYELTPEEEAQLTEFQRMERARQAQNRGSRFADAIAGIAGAIDPDKDGVDVIQQRQAARDKSYDDALKRQRDLEDRKIAEEDRARTREREDYDFDRTKTTDEREDVEYDENRELKTFFLDPASEASQLVRGVLAEEFPDVGFDDLNSSQMEMMMEHPAVKLALDRKMADREFANELAKLRETAKTKEPKETTVDREIAKDYAEFENTGGATVIESDIGKLDEIVARLNNGEDLSGTIMSYAPEWARTIADQEGLDAQQVVEQVIQKNLRAILGGQFAQAEAEQLIKRAYDPRLEPEANAKRLQGAIDEMRGMLDNRVETFKRYGHIPTGESGVVNWEDL